MERLHIIVKQPPNILVEVLKVELAEEEIHVHCPFCSNKRLFDCGASAEGIIKIKCPCCRAVSVINLQYVTEKHRSRRIVAYKKAATNYIQ